VLCLLRTATRLDEEPCDYQNEGSCLVPGAVESDRDVTFLGTSFFGGTGKLSAGVFFRHNPIFFFVNM